MKRVFLAFLLSFGLLQLRAQQVDTIGIFSPSMNKIVPNVVILPDDYAHRDSLPVVYLLHGHGMNHRVWLDINPELPRIATQYGLMIVCPDGRNSWYWDSPVDSASRYETYVAQELVDYIDSHYKTRTDKTGRAITGLSMGGHGALWLAIRHQDRFGACGSTSGGVDIRPFPNNWNMKELLGEYAAYPERWDAHTVMTQLHLIRPGSLAIIFDCGTEDFFHPVNERLHRELLYRNIRHDYLVRPGTHTRPYWRNSIPYQLLFFSDYFQRASGR